MSTKMSRLITSRVGIISSRRRARYISMLWILPSLPQPEGFGPVDADEGTGVPVEHSVLRHVHQALVDHDGLEDATDHADGEGLQIGRASCRERVCQIV